tara:strand:+ start:6032 stop:6295 length:264 start_codon:yes stop_codon:yes gene_type:complete
MEELIPIIKEVGFPIVVAFFVLLRLNGSLDKLKVSIDTLSDKMSDKDNTLAKLTTKVDMLERTVFRLSRNTRRQKNSAPKVQPMEKE